MVQVDGVGLVMERLLQQDTRVAVPVDWATILHQATRAFEMSERALLRWVSQRSSLQVACELLGIALSPSIDTRFTASDVDVLLSLGDLLFKSGLPVPQLMEHHRVQYAPRGTTQMGFSLSKEDYLRERACGKSKNRIAREQGISGPALFHWIHKWGLQDARVEAQEIERLQSRARVKAVGHDAPADRSAAPRSGSEHRPIHLIPAPGPEPNPRQIPAQASSASASPLRPLQADGADTVVQVSLRLPCPLLTQEPDLPESSPTAAAKLPESRDERMQFALRLLAACIETAHRDHAEMLGEDAAAAQLQRYVDHQLARCFGPGVDRP
ncbi:MAG: hypothetical protein K6T78_11450 [Alicyclobacillus sp.]|nr:hypothetical protein [Alicyclobacillus sp.]